MTTAQLRIGEVFNLYGRERFIKTTNGRSNHQIIIKSSYTAPPYRGEYLIDTQNQSSYTPNLKKQSFINQSNSIRQVRRCPIKEAILPVAYFTAGVRAGVFVAMAYHGEEHMKIMKLRKLFFIAVILFIFPGISSVFPGNVSTLLVSRPAGNGNHVAFVYGEDLWVADINGSQVRRLTAAVA